MPQVTVTIDAKQYRMACEEGQQEHLTALAARFDRYVGHLKESFGEIGDGRLTVMAGIMVMDEMAELQKRIERLEDEVEDLREAKAVLTQENDHREAAFEEALGGLAERIEGLADRLNA
ncbi:MAG: cell division protein ZapA [Mesorhizobium amorphae]|nr:MAG: cell division protein ZapA [Mesorhizobium amorphae]